MDTHSKGGRPATGSLKWRRPAKGGEAHWHVRLTSADGSRPFVPLDPKIPHEDIERAKACARIVSTEARVSGAVSSRVKETVEEYSKRWLTDRELRGITTVTHDRGRLRKHVLPKLGTLDVCEFDREDVEHVVESLDRKIRLAASHDDHLSWKTASNVWVLLSKMCRDMVEAKRRDLRVREDNAAERVAPPERGESRAKNYLYPNEFRRLVECKGVDVAFRTLYAAAVCTYARAGELEALTWDDVDLEHGIIHITKAVERRTGNVASTKSGITRRIPIEKTLRPLLERLLAARKKTKGERVFWMPDDEDRAVMLRQHLRTAGVARAELFADDAQRKHITFHDLRATGITWSAVRGDDPLRIKQRAGHSSFSTTEIYIREAENLADGFGEPFPPLPPDLTAGGLGSVSDSATPPVTPQPNFPANEWSKGGSNP